MKIKIEIVTKGAAFGDDEFDAATEVIRVIQKDVVRLIDGGLSNLDHRLLDLNGNTCGFIKVTK
jgi:hypothetical protein